MATRCTIKIEGINYAKVYKHWDGSPKHTLQWLKHFNKSFTENRGEDPIYKFAQLLRSSIYDAKTYGLNESLFTGWGVVELSEGMGAEYEYTLKINGKVTYKSI